MIRITVIGENTMSMEKIIQVRTEEPFFKRLKRVAKSKGLSVSAYIRMVILERVNEEDGISKKTQ